MENLPFGRAKMVAEWWMVAENNLQMMNLITPCMENLPFGRAKIVAEWWMVTENNLQMMNLMVSAI